MQVSTYPSLDAKLSDICIGTSAAPTLLPSYYFQNEYGEGKRRDFHLIDGGIADVNPVNSPHRSFYLLFTSFARLLSSFGSSIKLREHTLK